MNTKAYFYICERLTKLTHKKHEYNTDITQSPGRYIFMRYLQEIVNQIVNILMKAELYINLNTKFH